MHESLARLKTLGARGCMLAGDPGYYARFGFGSRRRLVHAGAPRANFLVLSFGECEAAGTVTFDEGFGAVR